MVSECFTRLFRMCTLFQSTPRPLQGYFYLISSLSSFVILSNPAMVTECFTRSLQMRKRILTAFSLSCLWPVQACHPRGPEHEWHLGGTPCYFQERQLLGRNGLRKNLWRNVVQVPQQDVGGFRDWSEDERGHKEVQQSEMFASSPNGTWRRCCCCHRRSRGNAKCLDGNVKQYSVTGAIYLGRSSTFLQPKRGLWYLIVTMAGGTE